MKKMKLSDIKIKESFALTVPKDEKLCECRYNWLKYHRQDRYIVVDHNNELIDGYVMYLILKENGVEEAEIKVSERKKKRWYRKNSNNIPYYANEETTYVYGIHPNSKCTKEFVWRVPKSWEWFASNVQIGDTILCSTKFGCSPVIVTRIAITDKCPVDLRVRKVCGKEIRRNGYVVKLA